MRKHQAWLLLASSALAGTGVVVLQLAAAKGTPDPVPFPLAALASAILCGVIALAAWKLLGLRTAQVVTSVRNGQRRIDNRMDALEAASRTHLDQTKNLGVQIKDSRAQFRRDLDTSALSNRQRKAETRLLSAVTSSALLHADALDDLSKRVDEVQRDSMRITGDSIRATGERLRELQAKLEPIGGFPREVATMRDSLLTALAEHEAHSVAMARLAEQAQSDSLRTQVAHLQSIQDGLRPLAGAAEELERLKGSLEEGIAGLENRLGQLSSDSYNSINERLAGLRNALEPLADVHRQLAEVHHQMEQLSASPQDLDASLGRLVQDLNHSNSTLQRAITRRIDGVRAAVDTSSAEAVQQVEALLQLMPRVDTSNRRYPPLGKWSMDPQGLLLVADLVQQHQPRLILELGSGSSTVWIGALAASYGARVVSVEHDPHFFAVTSRLLEQHGLTDTVTIVLAELAEHTVGDQTVSWYARDFIADVESVDMLVVDGPPRSTGPAARRPALPLLDGALSDQCMIVVDDCQRQEEQEMLQSWLADYPRFVQAPELQTSRTCVLIPTTQS